MIKLWKTQNNIKIWDYSVSICVSNVKSDRL